MAYFTGYKCDECGKVENARNNYGYGGDLPRGWHTVDERGDDPHFCTWDCLIKFAEKKKKEPVKKKTTVKRKSAKAKRPARRRTSARRRTY